MDRHAAAVAAQEDGGGREAGGEGGRRRGLSGIRPIYLLADSRPLFLERDGEPWLAAAIAGLGDEPRAAYLGAANGDEPAYYSIFQAAMERIGVHRRRMILAGFPPEDREFLAAADLILLAGGDPVRGWRAFAASGIGDIVVRRFYAGATLIGVSAGAVQLGWAAAPPEWTGEGAEQGERPCPVATFRLVPYFVDVHDEARDWRRLTATVAASGTNVPGLGIPGGAAAVVHPDGALEPAGGTLVEIVPAASGDEPERNVLAPPAAAAERARTT